MNCLCFPMYMTTSAKITGHSASQILTMFQDATFVQECLESYQSLKHTYYNCNFNHLVDHNDHLCQHCYNDLLLETTEVFAEMQFPDASFFGGATTENLYIGTMKMWSDCPLCMIQ